MMLSHTMIDTPFALIRDVVSAAADSIGFAHDRALLIFCLIAGFPLAIVHRLLPSSPSLKHARPSSKRSQ